MISASGKVRTGIIMEFCQCALNRKGIPDEWQTSVLVRIFKRKENIRNCNTYRGVKMSKLALKIVEKVLQRKI